MNELSWGRFPKVSQKSLVFSWADEFQSVLQKGNEYVLPRGAGRSYGDSCLSVTGGILLPAQYLNRFISFDPESGVLKAQAGVTIDQILKFFVPRGYFVPVTPGTKFVTLAGALANDIHGKNHHVAGNFSHHVLSFELVTSDGQIRICSRQQNSDFFSATVGGLGLTGFVTWIELRLIRINSAYINQETIQFNHVEEFLSLSAESDETHEYSVAWVDCFNEDGKGLFIRGNFQDQGELRPHSDGKLSVPIELPSCLLNKYSISAFNLLYFHKQITERKNALVHYEPFFYPLDAIKNWNRIYGSPGFLQYQFVIPFNSQTGQVLQKMFKNIRKSGHGSFLAVLKSFGKIAPEGMLSFPREGVTLALDFPVNEKVFNLLNDLDEIVFSEGGALYPAKDSRMSPESFARSFSRISEFRKFIDPKIGSAFAERVGLIK